MDGDKQIHTPTPYEQLLHQVYQHGEDRIDRTGTGTRSIFGAQMRFDLRDSFPLITSKRVYWRGVVEELLWFLRGSTNAKELNRAGVTIWDEWAREDGELGPIYGKQWRRWGAGLGVEPLGMGRHIVPIEIDQIREAIRQIKETPHSRRIIVSAWNVGEIDRMALPPCHVLFQFYVHGDGSLSCQMYQRSADLFLGVPFNIASYALLTCMVAHECGLRPRELIHTIGDAHIYHNHQDQVLELLTREPKPLPQLIVAQGGINATYDDIHLIDYKPHPSIKAPVAV